MVPHMYTICVCTVFPREKINNREGKQVEHLLTTLIVQCYPEFLL